MGRGITELTDKVVTLHASAASAAVPSAAGDGGDVIIYGTHFAAQSGKLRVTPSDPGVTVANLVVYGRSGNAWVQADRLYEDDGSTTLTFDGSGSPRDFPLNGLSYTRLACAFTAAGGEAAISWVPTEVL